MQRVCGLIWPIVLSIVFPLVAACEWSAKYYNKVLFRT